MDLLRESVLVHGQRCGGGSPFKICVVHLSGRFADLAGMKQKLKLQLRLHINRWQEGCALNHQPCPANHLPLALFILW